MNEQAANDEQVDENDAEVEGHGPIIATGRHPRPALPIEADAIAEDSEVIGHGPIIATGRGPALPAAEDLGEVSEA